MTDETDGKSALATQLSAVEAEQQRMHCEHVQLSASGAELQQTRAGREAPMDHIPNREMELGHAHARIAATDTTCQKLLAKCLGRDRPARGETGPHPEPGQLQAHPESPRCRAFSNGGAPQCHDREYAGRKEPRFVAFQQQHPVFL